MIAKIDLSSDKIIQESTGENAKKSKIINFSLDYQGENIFENDSLKVS